MLRVHFIQQWFNLSDPAIEDALYDMALFSEFMGLDAGEDNLPGSRRTHRSSLPRPPQAPRLMGIAGAS